MKITKYLILSVAIGLFSCSKDDDPIPTNEGMIGMWSITALIYSGSTTTSFAGTSITADFTGKGKDMNLTTTFSADPNIVSSSGSYIIELTTTVMGSSTTEDYLFDEAIPDGTWELNDKTLSITTTAGGTQEATIIKQTSTSLQVKVAVTETASDLGITVTTNVMGVYTFKKL